VFRLFIRSGLRSAGSRIRLVRVAVFRRLKDFLVRPKSHSILRDVLSVGEYKSKYLFKGGK